MKKQLKKILIIVLCVALVISGIVGGIYAYDKSTTSKNPVEVAPVSNYADYWAGAVYNSTYGNITTDISQDIYMQSTQEIKEVFVEEGQTVSIGDPLVRFDTGLKEIQLESQGLRVQTIKTQMEDEHKALNLYQKLKVGGPKIERLTISGFITWNTFSEDQTLPETVDVTLYRKIPNGEPEQVGEVQKPVKKDYWFYSWEGLSNYDDNGNLYTYFVKQSKVDGFSTSYEEDSYNISNTATGTVEVKGGLAWFEEPADNTKRPDELKVQLCRRASFGPAEKIGDETTINKSNNWKYDFGNQPKYDGFGSEYEYRLALVKDIDGYTAYYDKMNIHMVYNKEMTVPDNYLTDEAAFENAFDNGTYTDNNPDTEEAHKEYSMLVDDKISLGANLANIVADAANQAKTDLTPKPEVPEEKPTTAEAEVETESETETSSEESTEPPVTPEAPKDYTVTVNLNICNSDNAIYTSLYTVQLIITCPENADPVYRLGFNSSPVNLYPEEEPKDYGDPIPWYFPDKETEEEEKPEEEPVDKSRFYTQEEINKLISDKQLDIRDLEINLKMEENNYDKLKEEVNASTVVSSINGIVKSVIDSETAAVEGKPLISITGSEGYYVQGTLSELDLEKFPVGATVTLQSWESGTNCEATITEISQYPTENNNGWGNGNRNVSYYPFTAYIDGQYELRNGEGVEISLGTNTSMMGPGMGGTFYIPLYFVKEENGQKFVYIAGEDGLLKKQPVVTGKTAYGYSIEIKEGLLDTDLIAIPFGKNVKEGAKIEDKSDSPGGIMY